MTRRLPTPDHDERITTLTASITALSEALYAEQRARQTAEQRAESWKREAMALRCLRR